MGARSERHQAAQSLRVDLALVHLPSRVATIAITLLLVAYAFIPGDPSGLLTGWPWRDAGGLIVALAILALLAGWIAPSPPRWRVLIVVLVALTAIRVGTARQIAPEGWGA